MKRIVAVVLSILMVLSLLAACGSQESASGTTAAAGTTSAAAETEAASAADAADTQAPAADTQAPAADTQAPEPTEDEEEEEDEEPAGFDEIVDINVYFYCMNIPNEIQAAKVYDAINAISEEQIGVHANIYPISMGSWDQQLSLAMASGEQVDLMPTFFYGATSLPVMQSTNQLMALDELLDEYGQDILSLTRPEYLDTTRVNGEITAVPIHRDIVANMYYQMRKDVLEDLGLLEQAEAISSMSDVEAILKAVQEQTDLIPLAPAGAAGVLNFQPCLISDKFEDAVFYDQLVDTYCVTMSDDPYTVVDLYETEAYKDTCKLLEDWNSKGYIYPDAVTTEDESFTFVRSGKCFSFFNAGEAATIGTTEANCGYPMLTVLVASMPVTTTSVNTLNWVIPVTAQEPEAAMAFLNLMFTSAEIVDLLNFGLEGEDYIIQEDGTYNFPEGMAYDGANYHIDLTWLFGNQYLAGLWDGFEPDTRQVSQEINDNAATSPLLGFAVDTSDMSGWISNVSSAYQEFYRGLNCGAFDVDEVLPQYIAKLQAGGISDMCAAVQEQLDAWRAAQ